MGDTGDNIHGIPGWGKSNSLKAIQEHGNYKQLYKHLHEKYDSVREKFPDLQGECFDKLFNLRTDKEQEKFDKGETWKGKYPEIKEGMPFTGVALAFEEETWKPSKKTGVKNEIMALIFEERIELAYSLKKMDDNIPDLPDVPPDKPCDLDKLKEYFEYFDIESLKDDMKIFEQSK